MLSELLYADGLVLMIETIEELRKKFRKKDTFISSGLKVNLGNSNVIVRQSITKYGLSKCMQIRGRGY